MLIHKIWIFFAQLFSRFTLPTSQFHFAKWWSPGYYFGYFVKSTFPGCQVHFAKSQSPQCPIVKSMLPSQHSQATNSTPPRHHCQIGKSKFALWTAHSIKNFWAVECLNFFWSAETSAQKNQTLSKFKLPSKLNFNILRAYWNVLSSHFIFFTSIFMNDVDLKAS
jgi:hypothetical protein